jgi:squalene synthase HpnC
MSVASIHAELTAYGPQAAPFRGDLAAAREYCQQFGQRFQENFTVTSWLLPRELRPHFQAVYAFCRWADDLGDEFPHEQALSLLQWWNEQLDSCLVQTPTHPVFAALAPTIREFDIPVQLFRDLLIAFVQDQNRKRYATVNELLQYCQYSANPVGRIVLHLFRQTSPQQLQWSDSICTGLQWVNFCQDVSRDWYERGRIYLPQSEWSTHDVAGEESFAAKSATPEMRRLICAETRRALTMLETGRTLTHSLPYALGRNIELIVRGGLAIGDKILALDGEVLSERPKVSKWQKLCLLWSTWWSFSKSVTQPVEPLTQSVPG